MDLYTRRGSRRGQIPVESDQGRGEAQCEFQVGRIVGAEIMPDGKRAE